MLIPQTFLRVLLPLWLIPALLAGHCAAQDDPPDAAVEYMVLVTGGEVLSGAFPDAHTYFLTRTLYPLGLRCVGSLTVDDRTEDIHAALRFAGERVRLIIVTGGLGPTENDITREALSEFTGIPLAEHPQVMARMERRAGVGRDQMRANLRRQARVPTRGTYLANGGGSSVGLIFEWDGRVIVALPGPPGELQSMVSQRLVPWLAERFGTRLPGSSLTIRFVGLGQSQIDETLQQHAPLAADMILQSLFEAGRVDFTFVLPDETSENRLRLEELKQKILAHLGDHVYGVGQVTLEEVVIERLSERGETLAIAEAGSGGALASALFTAEGAERVLQGGVVAGDDQRLGSLLEADRQQLQTAGSGSQRAAILAAAAAEHLHAGWGLAVGQLQTAGDGSRYVDVALCDPAGRTEQQRIGLRGTAAAARGHLTTRLLDLLWRKLR